MKNVYLLKCDADGTMRSIDKPFGYAVTTEDEAKKFVNSDKGGYSNSYEKVTIIESIKEIKDLTW